ncbi:MAG: arginase family protein [Nanoarchaeota archaeon]|nr:arginase family protein [Nanoarchaeota archaeon]
MFIVKVPGINGLGKTKGCEGAGNAVLDALKDIYSNERGVPVDARLLDLEEIHLDNSDLKLSGELIYKNSLEAFETKPRTVFIGGDHSVSYPLTNAFLDYCNNEGKKPCLIVFDAHPDCMATFRSGKEGSRPTRDLSREIDESNLSLPRNRSPTLAGNGGMTPTHEEWLRALIERGFPAESIFLVGARNSDPSELAFLKEKGVKVMSVNQILENLDDSADILLEFTNGKEVYISIDIDCIDPAFAPATGYCEPGGLTSRQFLYILQRLNRAKGLKAFDIVEINPTLSGAELTVKLGAKILSELI